MASWQSARGGAARTWRTTRAVVLSAGLMSAGVLSAGLRAVWGLHAVRGTPCLGLVGIGVLPPLAPYMQRAIPSE